MIKKDLEEILKTYSEELLLVGDVRYGILYRSTSDAADVIVITNNGLKLCERHPSLLVNCVNMTPIYTERRELIAEGLNGDVYRFQINGDTVAIKEYRTLRENGIVQLRRLAELGHGMRMRNLQKIRTPTLYFASSDILCMEFVEAPTWEEIIKKHPEKKESLMESLYNSGGMEFITENNVDPKTNGILVKEELESKEHEFIIIDQ